MGFNSAFKGLTWEYLTQKFYLGHTAKPYSAFVRFIIIIL
jgi:hypothetical protein